MPVAPATQEAEVGGSLEAGRLMLQGAMTVSFHSSLSDTVRSYLKKNFFNLDHIKKNHTVSWVQWCIPVIPVLWEAEVGSLLEPRGSRAAWATT